MPTSLIQKIVQALAQHINYLKEPPKVAFILTAPLFKLKEAAAFIMMYYKNGFVNSMIKQD